MLGERNRIAREIHDTLAQGYVGICVQLEVLSDLLAMSKIEAARSILTRHAAMSARASPMPPVDLGPALAGLRRDHPAGSPAPLGRGSRRPRHRRRFSIFGAYRPLPPGTERELLRIAQEAIHNVKNTPAPASLRPTGVRRRRNRSGSPRRRARLRCLRAPESLRATTA